MYVGMVRGARAPYLSLVFEAFESYEVAEDVLVFPLVSLLYSSQQLAEKFLARGFNSLAHGVARLVHEDQCRAIKFEAQGEKVKK